MYFSDSGVVTYIQKDGSPLVNTLIETFAIIFKKISALKAVRCCFFGMQSVERGCCFLLNDSPYRCLLLSQAANY